MTDVFLVSFCNIGQGQSRVGELSPDGTMQPLPMPEGVDSLGATGFVITPEKIIISLQAYLGSFVVMDHDYGNAYIVQRPELKDLHGLILDGDTLLAVSTGTNQIFRLSLDLQILGTVGPVSTDIGNRDHINDICLVHGRPMASMFGISRLGGLRTGAAFDVINGEVIFDGFNDPHSLTWFKDRLYLLDSATGALYDLDPWKGPKRLLSVFGYARGLHIDDDFILIGKSAHRHVGRTSSNQHADRLYPAHQFDDLISSSGIYIYDRLTGTNRFIDTTAFASEVYQIRRFTKPEPKPQPAELPAESAETIPVPDLDMTETPADTTPILIELTTEEVLLSGSDVDTASLSLVTEDTPIPLPSEGLESETYVSTDVADTAVSDPASAPRIKKPRKHKNKAGTNDAAV